MNQSNEINPADYLVERIQEEGIFHAVPLTWTLKDQLPSGSQPLNVAYAIKRQWDDEEEQWLPAEAPGLYVEGTFWILKREGAVNEFAAKQMMEVGMWSGDPAQFNEAPDRPQLNVTVKASESNGRVYFNVDWVAPHVEDQAPSSSGGGAKVIQSDPAVVGALGAQHGATFRALAAKVKGAPAPPPAPRIEDEEAPF